jgi:hypothetical protein
VTPNSAGKIERSLVGADSEQRESEREAASIRGKSRGMGYSRSEMQWPDNFKANVMHRLRIGTSIPGF